MRLVSFHNGYAPRLGAQMEDRVIDLQAAHIARQEAHREPVLGAALRVAQAQVPAEALEFISLGESALDLARQALEGVMSGEARQTPRSGRIIYELGEIRLLPPISRPGKIVAIGLNYKDHAAESNMQVPKNPVLFAKFATCLVGPGEAVIHPGPPISTQLDYEVELAVIIGRRGKYIQQEEALQYVYGYSIMNDVSARDLQFEDSQWMKGKALDTFAPFGPAIVTADEIANPHSLDITLRLNGVEMQHSNTSNMLFSVERIVGYLSHLITLEPGDVIATGTPSGVGFSRQPPVYLQPGDVMEAEIEGIGVLTNPVVAATAVGSTHPRVYSPLTSSLDTQK